MQKTTKDEVKQQRKQEFSRNRNKSSFDRKIEEGIIGSSHSKNNFVCFALLLSFFYRLKLTSQYFTLQIFLIKKVHQKGPSKSAFSCMLRVCFECIANHNVLQTESRIFLKVIAFSAAHATIVMFIHPRQYHRRPYESHQSSSGRMWRVVTIAQ